MVSSIPFRRLAQHLRSTLKYRNARRYGRLLREVEARAPLTIAEVGVYHADRAREMIAAAALSQPLDGIRYYGFDLFDQFTPDMLEAEYSKTPLTLEEASRRLARSGAHFELFPGLSQETLPKFVSAHAGSALDFVFIDGGHAIQTIRSDWLNLQQLTSRETTVIFDDYYVDCPWLTGRFGCNRVLDELDTTVFRYELIGTPDRFRKPQGVLQVALARVWRR